MDQYDSTTGGTTGTDAEETGFGRSSSAADAQALGPSLRRLGVLDLGSNTFHLAIAEVGPGSGLTMLSDVKEPVRLTSALAEGRLDDSSWVRARAALRFLVACARGFDGLALTGVATSAFRDADNGASFIAEATREHRLPIEILDGAEEGRLVFAAACSEIPTGREHVVVVDVGGGSVELAVGRARACRFARSMPLGVLRLRQRHVPLDGVMEARHADAISTHVATFARMTSEKIRRLRPRTLLLTGGTARALGRLGQSLGVCPPGRLTRRGLRTLVALLSDRRPGAMVDLGVDPSRADTVGPGAVAIATLMDLIGVGEALVCRRGLREGVLLREAGGAR